MLTNFKSRSLFLSKPKLLFMAGGFISLVLSVSLWFSGARDQGLFVGLWVPAIHSLGTLVLTDDRRTQ